MIKIFLSVLIVLSFSFLTYPESAVKSDKPLIYNEEALTKELKDKDKEAVTKILGNPAIKKPCEECNENLGYWWYLLPEASIFVHFKDDRVYDVRVLTEDKRSKKLWGGVIWKNWERVKRG